MNLVELKFPSLVGSLAPFESPWAAVAAARSEGPLVCVVSCPGQRSALDQRGEVTNPAGGTDTVDCVLPEGVRGPAMRELTAADVAETAAVESGPGAGTPRRAALDEEGLLLVSGIRHVIAVLEELEDGLLEDVTTLEAYACEGGCFGSPLLFEDHHVARRRWERGQAAVEAAVAASPGSVAGSRVGAVAGPAAGTAVARHRPYAARPGIRLDPDMGLAIQKLGSLQAVIRSLPGRDCGTCGAPTCAALAEDVVMERATVEFCPYMVCEKEEAKS